MQVKKTLLSLLLLSPSLWANCPAAWVGSYDYEDELRESRFGFRKFSLKIFEQENQCKAELEVMGSGWMHEFVAEVQGNEQEIVLLFEKANDYVSSQPMPEKGYLLLKLEKKDNKLIANSERYDLIDSEYFKFKSNTNK